VDNYITAKDFIQEYCSSKGSAAEEWIASVSVGSQIQNSGSSGTTGYEDFTAVEFSAESGQSPVFKLTPAFSKNPRTQYWRIWIDYNGDSDFDDA
jgi:hypothetical protein